MTCAISFVGRLTDDIKVNQQQNGSSARFSVAVDRPLSAQKKQEAQQKGLPTADFYNCVAFGKSAENIAGHYKKGDVIVITDATYSTNRYVAQDGTQKTSSNFIVNRYVPAYELVSRRQADEIVNSGNNRQQNGGYNTQQGQMNTGNPSNAGYGQQYSQPQQNAGYPQYSNNSQPQQSYPQQGFATQVQAQHNGYVQQSYPQQPAPAPAPQQDFANGDGQYVVDESNLPF